MNGDFHTDQEPCLPFTIFPSFDAMMVDEIKSDIANYERRALDCRKRGNEHQAQAWDAKAAAARLELARLLPPQMGG